MASLDSCRRRILVNILTQDKSFKQVFLITHTDFEFGDYNSIMVTEDENGKRLVDYTPLRLWTNYVSQIIYNRRKVMYILWLICLPSGSQDGLWIYQTLTKIDQQIESPCIRSSYINQFYEKGKEKILHFK